MKSSTLLLLFLLVLTPLSTWCQEYLSFLERYYVPLNVDGTQDDKPNSHFSPTTHHFIEIPNIDFTAFSTGFSIEGWVLWRGTNLCTAPLKNDENCPGIEHAPVFLIFQDASNYLYLTPAINATLRGPLFKEAESGYSMIKAASTSFGTQQQILRDDPLTSLPEGMMGFAWNHISFSWRPAGNSELVITHATDTFPFFATNTFSLAWSGWNPSSLGTTSLYFGGFDSNRTPPVGTATNFLMANLAEFRIWNKFRSVAEVASTRLASLIGNEPGLVHNWKMDEPSGTVITDYSQSGINGNILSQAGDNPLLPTRLRNSQAEAICSDFSGVNMERFFSLSSIYKSMGPSDSINFGVSVARRESTLSLNFTSLPAVLKDQNTQSPITSSFGFGCPVPVENYCGNTFTYSPSRQFCGTNATLTIYHQTLAGTVPIESSVPMSVIFQISSIQPVITNNNYQTPTSGGLLTFSGSNFGTDGTLAPGEYFRIRIGSQLINCNGTVSSNSIQCPIPSGVGSGGKIEFFSCGQLAEFPNYFSYQAPTIGAVTGTNDTTLSIVGTNFGTNPNNVTIQIISDTATIPCSIVSMSHTQIICNNGNQLTSGSTYTISILVGGQLVDSSFEYNICEFGCENGGRCVGRDICSCVGLSFGGARCADALICSPACKRGACINSNENLPFCECPEGYSGADCGSSGSLTLSIALGVAGGLLFIIIVLVIVVIIVARRRPKRYTGELWVPLEKKEFDKIIYGDQLSENAPKGSGDLKTLEQMLVEQDLKLVSTICELTQITEADKVAKALVIIFQSHTKVLSLLEKFIVDEVAATENAGNLFRSNSMVSKMFKFYSRLIGLPYLYETIGPEITQLVAEQIGLEVDPEKMEDGADLDEMRWTLMAQSQKILKEILNSSEKCPSEFRQLFVHIEKAVRGRYPENVRTTIGGFIFLRFFCPAVSSPEAYGILDDPPSASSRRLLILITKVLQNLSNDVEFGAKEPYMTKMNDFVQANREKLSKFYDKLLKPSTKSPIDVNLPKNIKAVSLGVVSQHIRSILDKVEDKELRAKLDQVVAKE